MSSATRDMLPHRFSLAELAPSIDWPREGPQDTVLQALAVAVVRRAVKDAKRRDGHGATARRFLDDSDELRWWCHLAGVETEDGSPTLDGDQLSRASAR